MRINAALEQADAPAAAAGTVVPISRRGRAWNSPAVAGAAAVAAAVVLVGALVAGNVIHRGGNPSSEASSQADASKPKAADSTPTKEWSTGANYTAATIPNLAPRLVTGTPPPNASFGAQASGGTTNGTVGTSRNLTSGPAQAPVPAAPSPAGVITPDDMRSNPSAVVACGTILAGGVPTVPVAVDFASYQGKPAVIFVLPAAGNKALLDVWVVKSTCSSSSVDLYFRRIPRPTG